ncbi:uncharacterized protein EV154DRAFT_488263 [Mucor mucedo]|uniref:uncharacterized protein n=1 Tax=Mucor mucedo TaxID=29922 RepID=UPI00222020B1|nr:uncharacterized protein EV154DRAFT_488263 [Mucor mucedo]KAI7867765.1 hypothetical protein EV154DRAFT_488263 [Mucor mucedo]
MVRYPLLCDNSENSGPLSLQIRYLRFPDYIKLMTKIDYKKLETVQKWFKYYKLLWKLSELISHISYGSVQRCSNGIIPLETGSSIGVFNRAIHKINHDNVVQ